MNILETYSNKALVSCTFAGKRGDALWSMPTVREIANKYGPVDFYMMDHFSNICEVIKQQPYIESATGLTNWLVDGNRALQDPMPPLLPKEYDKQFDLSYRGWPHGPLMHFIADQCETFYGEVIDLGDDPLPFLDVDTIYTHEPRDVCFGYSIYYDTQKDNFINLFVNKMKEHKPDFTWIDSSFLPWDVAASWTKLSTVFVGDCSAPHVVAVGMDKPVILTESNGERRTNVFLCPYADLITFECTNILERLDDYVNETLRILF